MPSLWVGDGPSYPGRDSIMPCGLWGGKREIGREAVSVFGSQGGFSRYDMGFSCGVDLAFSRFSLGVAYEAGLIDIDKSDTVYGNDSRMIGYKNVRNRCFLIRTGVNF